MKPANLSALLAPILVQAQWYGGAPNCAKDCLESQFSSSAEWPAPTAYCSTPAGAAVSSCISASCKATPTALASYSSQSSSMCAQWSSCSAGGSTGVYTLSAPAVTAAATLLAGNNVKGPWGTATWTGGVYTVTGCEFGGSPWAGGPGGWGRDGAAVGGPWWGWGNGWNWQTKTAVVTRTMTDGAMSTGSTVYAVGESGSYTITSYLAQATGNAAAPNSDAKNLKVMGAVIGGVAAVAGLL